MLIQEEVEIKEMKKKKKLIGLEFSLILLDNQDLNLIFLSHHDRIIAVNVVVVHQQTTA